MTERYRAPFAPSGPSAIDEAIAEKLLAEALSMGGEYADLYFEYRASGGLVYEEGILKTANRGVTMGLGVRVQRGEATGYAYTEELEMEAMRKAAKTAAQIASGGTAPPVQVRARSLLPRRYEVEDLTLDMPGTKKRELLQRADRAARAYDPRITRVEASMAEEIREILIATSDGVMVYDRQPLMRFGVRAIAEDGKLRQAGSSGGGGR